MFLLFIVYETTSKMEDFNSAVFFNVYTIKLRIWWRNELEAYETTGRQRYWIIATGGNGGTGAFTQQWDNMS